MGLIQLTKEYQEKQEALKRQLKAEEIEYKQTLERYHNDINQAFIDFLYWDTDINTTVLSEYIDKPLNCLASKDRISSYMCKTCKEEITYFRGSRSQQPPKECKPCKDKREKATKAEIEMIRKRASEEVQELNSLPYKDYLQTTHWLTFRLRVLKRAEYKCQLCGKSHTLLNVHHRDYKNKGCEQYKDVIVLCADCHAKFHDKEAC